MSSRTTLTRALRTLTAGTIVAAATLTLAACSTDEPAASPGTSDDAVAEAPADDSALATLGLDGADARTIIDTLDALPRDERPETLYASIRPDELLVTDGDGEETSIAMPDDAFYVSLAPYVNQTHDCYFHSLTTCTGEIQNEEVHVVVTDDATGEVLLDETRTTFDNGFVGLWLPRDLDTTVTIEKDGLSASAAVSTGDSEDATCITTMQLA